MKKTNTEQVKNEVVKELKEEAEYLDIVGIDIQGLVSMISEYNIKMFDTSDYSINDIIKTIIESKASLNSFFLIDIGNIFRRYKLWMKHLSRVNPFYAIKCNSDKLLINTLVDLGIGFDVASKVEISMVKEFNVDPKKIIFANPVKEINHITYSQTEGINKLTFDSEDELKKISVFHPHAELVLRILVDDSKSRLPFGSKFGCPDRNIKKLFELAKTLKLTIIGVSFHVGSDCHDSDTYNNALKLSKDVFNIGKEYNYNMYFLDIGGGFPGHDSDEAINHFIEISENINKGLETYFNDIPNLQIIAEPGRFYATSCGILVTNVIGKKSLVDNDGEEIHHYYINSNLYGIFNNIIFDKAVPQIELLAPIKDGIQLYKSVIFGQTCDSLDRIAENIKLPELSCGSWLIVRNHGAYTLSSGSKFNGFELTDINYVFTY